MKCKYRCIKCGSSSSQDASITFHRFPTPGSTNSLRCELWAKFCFPNEPWSSPVFQRKLFSQHKMLCSKHFSKTSYINQKLLRTAVPSEEIDEGQSEESQFLNDGTQSIISGPSEPWEASRAPSGEPDVKRPRIEEAAEELYKTEDFMDENPDVMDGADETGTPEDCPTTEFCRICLAAEGMCYAMEGNDKLCSLYETLTGLEPAGGGLPSLLCEGCAQSLLDLGRLRELARHSHHVMLRVADTLPQVTLEAIRSVEESQTVLEEHLDMDCFDNDHLSQEELVTIKDEDTGENSGNINTGSGTVKHSAKVKGTRVVRIGTNHDSISTNDNIKHFVSRDRTEYSSFVRDRSKSVYPQANTVSVKSENQCDDMGIAEDVKVKEETLEEDEASEFYFV